MMFFAFFTLRWARKCTSNSIWLVSCLIWADLSNTNNSYLTDSLEKSTQGHAVIAAINNAVISDWRRNIEKNIHSIWVFRRMVFDRDSPYQLNDFFGRVYFRKVESTYVAKLTIFHFSRCNICTLFDPI